MNVKAPWTPIQVLSLAAWQKCSFVHPYTYTDGTNGVDLIPTEDGWVTHVGGPVVQDWALQGSLDWSFADPGSFARMAAVATAVANAPRTLTDADMGWATITAHSFARTFDNLRKRSERARHFRETAAVKAEMASGKDKIGFYLDDSQSARVRIWMGECMAAKKDRSVSGGRFTYEFSPTGLGTCIKVKDALTKTEIDVSDYEDW